jgi:hypothetical protein
MNDAMCCSQQHMTKVPHLFSSFQLTAFVIPKINQCVCILHWLLSFIAVELSIAVMGVLHQQHMRNLLV